MSVEIHPLCPAWRKESRKAEKIPSRLREGKNAIPMKISRETG